MTQDTDLGSANPGALPEGSLRRAARLQQQPPTSLPTAAPVAHVGAGSAALRRRRALLVAGGAAAALLCATGGALLFGLRPATIDHAGTATSDISVGAGTRNPANALLGEGGGSPGPLPRIEPTMPPATPATPATPLPTALPAERPLADRPADAGGTSPDPAPGERPVPGAPAPEAGTPSGPGTPTVIPAAPQPLAFTGLTRNETIGLLGIRILSSDALSLSGEPGATASVSYGSSPAGSVTFDASGRATLTVGGSLIDLGDPVITVAYSDGTPGTAIHARRSTL